jgi:hypothetical protein
MYHMTAAARSRLPHWPDHEAIQKPWLRISCFVITGTITINDSLDLLAEFMGVKDQVAALTNKAS